VLVNIGDFFSFLGSGLLLYFFFAGSAATIWLLLRWLDPSPRSKGTHVAVALVGGPLLLSWSLVYLLYVAPGYSPRLYLAGLLLLISPCVLLSRKRGPRLHLRFANYPLYLASPLRLVILGPLIVGLGVLLFLICFLPLAGNDPLEYVQVGRKFAELRSTHWYPSVSAGGPGGIVAPWTHPPAYPGLIAIAYFIQGTDGGAGIARLIAPWFVAALLIGTVRYVGTRRWGTGPLAALLLLGTPLLFDLAVLAHVDCLRLAALVAAVLAARTAGASGSNGSLCVLAFACGMLLFTHSIGFVMMPIAVAVFFLLAWLKRRDIRSAIKHCGLVAALAALFVIPQLLQNLRTFGSILQDHVALYGLPHIKITEFLEATRYISTIGDKLVFGVLAPIFDVQQFGFIGFLALVALFRVVWRAMRHWHRQGKLDGGLVLGGEPIMVASFIVVVFTGGALISVMAGTVLLIKNPRYLMTIQPFVAILAANLLTDLGYAARRRMRRAAHRRSIGHTTPRQPLALVQKKVRLNPLARFAQFLVAWGAHAVTVVTTRPTAWVGTGLLLIVAITASAFPATLLREAFFTYRISLRTLFDPEFAKRAALDWSPARLERVLADRARPGEKVLSFRQADTGFYTSVPFISHMDERVLPVFDAPDALSAYNRLLALGVRWIYVPGYAMPEIFNSVIERLLFNTRLTSLIAEDAGWKVVRLREPPLADVKFEKAGGQDYGARPADSLQWNVIKASTSAERFGEIAAIGRVDRKGPISIDAENDWLTRRDTWRIITRGLWSGNLAGSGFLTRTSDFVAKFGVYRFTAVVEGAGYVEVAVSQDLRDNLVDRTFRHIVWSGVLSKGMRRTIRGVFRMGDNPIALDGILYQEQLAQVFFRVHQRAEFTLFSWNIEHVVAESGDDAPSGEGDVADDRVVADGWSNLDGYIKEASEAKEETQDAPLGEPPLPSMRPVAIYQLSSRVATLISPTLSALESGSPLLPKLEQRAVLPMLEIETVVRGTALGSLTAYLDCGLPRAIFRMDEDHPKSRAVTPEMRAKAQLADRYVALELGKVFAQPQRKRHRFVLRPPCQPFSVRIGYNLSGYATSRNDWGRANRLEVHGMTATYREAARRGGGTLIYRPVSSTLLLPGANSKP
jgi:4-amino-4-deoxy-L-arabinose transferase-like glycosyltransferase